MNKLNVVDCVGLTDKNGYVFVEIDKDMFRFKPACNRRKITFSVVGNTALVSCPLSQPLIGIVSPLVLEDSVLSSFPSHTLLCTFPLERIDSLKNISRKSEVHPTYQQEEKRDQWVCPLNRIQDMDCKEYSNCTKQQESMDSPSARLHKDNRNNSKRNSCSYSNTEAV